MIHTNKIFLLVISLSIIILSRVFAQQNAPVCAFLPFKNKSGFDNKNWDLVHDIPEVFADSLNKLKRHQFVQLETVDIYLKEQKIRSYKYEKKEILKQIAKEIEVDFFIIGQIDEFGLSRINLGSFMLGGYQSYNAVMKVSFFIYDYKNDIKTENYTCSSDVKQKDIGISLIGRPSKHYVSFEELDELEFNSTRFKQTIMGQALRELTDDFVTKFIEIVPGDSTEKGKEKTPEIEEFKEVTIVFIRENEIYLNAGSSDRLKEGDVLAVYTKGEPITDPATGEILGYADKLIGKIKVMAIKDNHLSLAKTIEQLEPIKVKDKVRIRKR
jgi:putative lipoic acid-binding regulatory protein